MRKKEKAAKIAEILEELYPETPIPLDHKDPYTLLVAVLLSAQCTDERVNKITPALFELADNLGLDLIAEMRRKMAKNAEKYPVEKARGSNLKYTEL